MKLELKHLSPYLPYKLRMANGNFIGELTAMLPVIGDFKITCSMWSESISENKYKPILRPLSDLTPYDNGEIDGMGETNDMILIRLVENTDNHYDAYDEWRDSYFDNPIQQRILQAPYEVFENLLAEHYDVFGLIDAGLAIDINTLKS